jgi:hypothetical protein
MSVEGREHQRRATFLVGGVDACAFLERQAGGERVTPERRVAKSLIEFLLRAW